VKRRTNVTTTTKIGAAGGTALVIASWVAFRLYVRQSLLAELEKEGLSQQFGFAQQSSGLIGLDLNLPTPLELAKSMVPIWSTVMPKEALYDVSQRGRSSKYWPDTHRTPSPLARFGLEQAAFATLR
jgi:hypothetical protein